MRKEQPMEKQIEEMKEVCCDVANFNICNQFDRCDDCPVLDIVNTLYNAGYRKQEWISVDERLPKQWERVLVFCDDIVSIDFISSMGRWYEHIDHDSVTHWMPLPEAPKMKGGAE